MLCMSLCHDRQGSCTGSYEMTSRVGSEEGDGSPEGVSVNVLDDGVDFPTRDIMGGVDV